jgi:hypothetical protein
VTTSRLFHRYFLKKSLHFLDFTKNVGQIQSIYFWRDSYNALGIGSNGQIWVILRYFSDSSRVATGVFDVFLADLSSGKNTRGYPWVESLGIEPGRSHTEYNFQVLLSVPEVVDDICEEEWLTFQISSIISERYETSTLADWTGFGVNVPGVQHVGVSPAWTFKSIYGRYQRTIGCFAVYKIQPTGRISHLVWQFELDWGLKVPKNISEDAFYYLWVQRSAVVAAL